MQMRGDRQMTAPRLLVLGGSGRLGAGLRAAWQRGDEAGVVPVWQARRDAAFAGFGGPTVVFDPLGAPEALQAAVAAADAVLLLAGPTRGTAAELGAHADLARATLQAARGKPVLLASSAAVYGQPADARPCHEDDPPAPLADYGRAKLAMEAVAAEFSGAVILRIGNVAGADALLGVPAPPGGRVLHILPAGHAPRRAYIGPCALAKALARLVRLAVAGVALPDKLNLALPGVVGMDDLLRAAGEGWQPAPAPETVIDRLELDVTRALALGLVPEAPVSVRSLLADLASVRR